MNQEFLEVVNEKNEVVELKSRKEVHDKNLLHRSIHIMLFNSVGRLALQKRSMNKDRYPGYFTSATSGHVNPGESYEQAAIRELKEELDIEAPIIFLHKFPGTENSNNEFCSLYKCITDKKLNLNKEEVDEIRFFSLKELKSLFTTEKIKITPLTKLILGWYLKEKRN